VSRILWFVGALAILTLVGIVYLTFTRTAARSDPAAVAIAQQHKSDLPAGITQEEYDSAKQSFEEAYDRAASPVDVFSWLGESSFTHERWKIAAASFAQIPSATLRYGHIARLYEGRALLKLLRAQEAEKNLQEFLALENKSPELSDDHIAEALLQLQYLYGIELRFEDRKVALDDLIKLGQAEVPEVLNYCFPTLHRWNGPQAVVELERFHGNDPKNPRLRVALGRYRMGQGELIEARQILDECHQEYPKSVTTAAALLSCLHEQDAWPEMEAVVDQLPPPADNQPWLLLRMRGHYYLHHQQFEKALDCFERVLKSNPSDVESCLGKAAALGALSEKDDQRKSLEMARELSRIQNRIGWALNQPDDWEALIEIADIAMGIGLQAEARLLVSTGLKRFPGNKRMLEWQKAN
jgi:tetratricopeptide (TPR) repeat protein